MVEAVGEVAILAISETERSAGALGASSRTVFALRSLLGEILSEWAHAGVVRLSQLEALLTRVADFTGAAQTE